MSETKRPRKCPVGACRVWLSGPVIKFMDNNLWNDGWMPLPTPPKYISDAIDTLDRLAKRIKSYSDPVDGGLWLDKEISEFRPSSGSIYSPKDFKQYSGFYGIEGYSFLSEFSKRYNSDKIDLKAAITQAVLDENSNEKLVLSKERIEDIKDEVKSNYKNNSSFNPKDITELKDVLERVNKYLEQGENFEDPIQLETYARNKKLLQSFGDTYEKLPIKRALRDKMLSEMDNAFQDNWGVRESFRKKLEDTYSAYIKKNIERIKKDEVEDFEKEIGCKINVPTKEFYEKLDNSSIVKDKEINLTDFIGKKVPDFNNKYEDVTLLRISSDGDVIVRSKDGHEKNYISPYTNLNEADELKKKLLARESTDLSIIFQLRFQELYNKNLEGNWDVADIPALHTFEKIIHYLPPGHCLNNNLLRKIEKDTAYSDKGNYAHYSPGDNSIYLSNSAMSSTDKFSELNSGNEFVSVLIHEIGHAVSEKFHRAQKTKYRDFSRQCGWGWDYLDKDELGTYHATGGDKDIKRTGLNNNVNLITAYAHKSPEEAFAEYYSFYNQYKTEINNLLDKNAVEGLHRDSSEIINPHYGKTVTVENIINTNIDPILRQNIDKELFSQQRNVQDNIKLQFESPWKLSHQTIREDGVDKKQLRNYINFVKGEDHKPLLAIEYPDGRKKLIGDEGSVYLNSANKIAKKITPICTVSEEFHTNLKAKGFLDQEIADYAFFSIKDCKYPLSKKTEWEKKTVSGLRYGSNGIIPVEKIIGSKEIFRKMRTIYYSDELKKALEN